MMLQATPLYATVWYPGRAGEPDEIDDSVWQVIAWTVTGSTDGDCPHRPVIVKLGGHNGPPVKWSYPAPDDETAPTLNYADSLADAQATIRAYPEEQRR